MPYVELLLRECQKSRKVQDFLSKHTFWALYSFYLISCISLLMYFLSMIIITILLPKWNLALLRIEVYKAGRKHFQKIFFDDVLKLFEDTNWTEIQPLQSCQHDLQRCSLLNYPSHDWCLNILVVIVDILLCHSTWQKTIYTSPQKKKKKKKIVEGILEYELVHNS